MEKRSENRPIAEMAALKLRFASEIPYDAAPTSLAMLCTDSDADRADDAIWAADWDAFANFSDAACMSPAADWMRASSENGGIAAMPDSEEERDAVEFEYDWNAPDTELMASYA